MGHRVFSLPICKMLSLCVFKSMGCFKLYQSFEYIDLVYPPLTAVALSCPSLLYWDLYHLYILTSVYTHVTHSCQTKVMSAQEQSRYSKWTFAFCPEHLLLLFFLPPPLIMLAWGLSLYLVWLPSPQHGPCTSCVSLFIAPLPSADVCEGDNTD